MSNFQPIAKRIAPRDGPDFYPTPAWATHALMQNETFNGSANIWEPACGDGAISKVIVRYYRRMYFNLYSSDINSHGYGTEGIDFLDHPSYLEDKVNVWNESNIITNPPYNKAQEFVEKALDVATNKVAMLLRLAFLEGSHRSKTLFTHNPPTRVWVFSERVTFYLKGAERKGSGPTAHAWFIWDKQDRSKTTTLHWLPPGYKKEYGDG